MACSTERHVGSCQKVVAAASVAAAAQCTWVASSRAAVIATFEQPVAGLVAGWAIARAAAALAGMPLACTHIGAPPLTPGCAQKPHSSEMVLKGIMLRTAHDLSAADDHKPDIAS